ncbi:translation initiation factor IF-2 [Striga asiatica]|uniref:Translation initiation factor IF-2 n=1 Tax=Striga asiatica TaxID=4170 RepID=A0A5A7RGT2_STRAF|nr:translation initiation factor IF-2 [Striga asiatica]
MQPFAAHCSPPPHELAIAADSPTTANFSGEQEERRRRLADGSRRRYHHAEAVAHSKLAADDRKGQGPPARTKTRGTMRTHTVAAGHGTERGSDVVTTSSTVFAGVCDGSEPPGMRLLAMLAEEESMAAHVQLIVCEICSKKLESFSYGGRSRRHWTETTGANGRGGPESFGGFAVGDVLPVINRGEDGCLEAFLVFVAGEDDLSSPDFERQANGAGLRRRTAKWLVAVGL